MKSSELGALMNRRPEKDNAHELPIHHIWRAVIGNGGASPSAITERTGLPSETVSSGLQLLKELGWVRYEQATDGTGTNAGYEVVPEAAWLAVVDLGGTKTHVAISDLAGNTVSEITEPTDVRGGLHVVERIAELCQAALHKAQLDRSNIDIAVVGVPGAPQKKTGRILMAPNVADFQTMDVAAILEVKLNAPVVLENDVNLAAIGEHWLGAGGQVDDMAFIALGTGIGGGLVVGGELVRGNRNAAGELGFMPFGGDPFDRQTDVDGALEYVVGAKGISRRYRELTGEERDVAYIFDAVGQGGQAALTVLDETARYVARAIAAVCAVVDPEKAVLGGSIGSRAELVSRVRYYLPQCFPHPVEVSASALGLRAAIAGGAAIARQSLPKLRGFEPAGLPPSFTSPKSEAPQQLSERKDNE